MAFLLKPRYFLKWFCRENQSLSGRVRLIVVFFVWWEIFWDVLPEQVFFSTGRGVFPNIRHWKYGVCRHVLSLTSHIFVAILRLKQTILVVLASMLWSYSKECPYNSSCSVDAEKRLRLLWVLLLDLELLCIVCVLNNI